MTSRLQLNSLRSVDGFTFGGKRMEAEISNKGFAGLLNIKSTFIGSSFEEMKTLKYNRGFNWQLYI